MLRTSEVSLDEDLVARIGYEAAKKLASELFDLTLTSENTLTRIHTCEGRVVVREESVKDAGEELITYAIGAAFAEGRVRLETRLPQHEFKEAKEQMALLLSRFHRTHRRPED